ncbi:unnamed protein product [Rotaria sordida]|uniref:PPC domain-containing protein n=1 Tax=Rotaria sordida TaxID=392033 RepID=A0A814RVN1_9BILA|nr:unnamed protein product [Rotaria sordida]CAF1138027.1 unnamed protein product [Rotaria sordida]CAF1228668.1 unnamed protein product [Rotaria sordida]CAF1233173.1 unnamed protein product [Rotaria sordida]CAF1242335.1 unnamed protein product [Rotaria sordida]
MPGITNAISNILTLKSKIKPQQRTYRQTPASTRIRCFPLRIGPGVELISTIHELMEDIDVQSLSILSCVGTLSACSLDSHQLNKKEYNIVSLSGTFDKQSHNIMGSFADSETGSLIGGKIRSLTVHTTCELMLAEPLDCTFSREFDPRTGQNELHVRRKLLTDL